ncbi:MAG: class I SAM-dependent methyltransferase [Anaerolineae bacterium]|nr:class I SAM-dependent methyltransferase [Anaerolineae bacterium]
MSQDKASNYENELNASRKLWDAEAAIFDQQPDHGLRHPLVRAAWVALLQKTLVPPPAVVLDIGCGTGSLSVVLAELGYDVTGVDLSTAMLVVAEEKARSAGYSIRFQPMDAAFPQLHPQQFNAIVCRHLLWTLPEPAQVLLRWADLLRAGGQLLLIEGYWHTNAGLHAEAIIEALPHAMSQVKVDDLSSQTDLWGGAVTDERYAITARLAP